MNNEVELGAGHDPRGPVQAQATKPLWRRIYEFPLVAMIVALAVLGISMLAVALATRAVSDAIQEPWWTILTAVLSVLVVFAAYKLVIRRLGAHKRDDLRGENALRDLALGFFGAGALMSLIVGVAAAIGVYRIEGWSSATDAVTIIFQAGLFAGFFEEVLMRGIVFRWIEEFAGSWIALLLSSLFFGFGHALNDNATIVSSIGIAMEAGILLGGAYMLTRSLWLAIGIHAGWNIVQGLVWDVPISGTALDGIVEARLTGPDLLSGGAFGLEASLIAMVIATAAGVWLVWLAVKRGEVVRPWWVRRHAR